MTLNMDRVPKIASLQSVKNERMNSMHTIYKSVLSRCIEKILYTNKNTNMSFLLFEVPEILIGHPRYNIKECVHYIMCELQRNDYLLHYIDPKYIYIDWGTAGGNEKGNLQQYTSSELRRLFPHVKNIQYVFKD